MRFTISTALCLLTVALSASEALTTYILAGQSNMLGRANTSELQASLQQPYDKALVFDRGKWVAFKPGNQFGPEVTFVRAMAANGRAIGVIKQAKGATSLAVDWKACAGEQYLGLIRKVTEARASRKIRLAGLIWAQGEADSKSPENASAYGDRLAEFIQRLRADLDTPGLPVVALRVNPPYPHVEGVRTAIEQTKLAHYAWIDGDDLEKAKDNIHYNVAGQLVLGDRFAKSLMALEKVK